MLIKSLFFLLQKLIDFLGLTILTVFKIFPSSPFSLLSKGPYSELISNINYFIPVYEFVAILQTYLIAVGIYYSYSYFARWFKAIQ